MAVLKKIIPNFLTFSRILLIVPLAMAINHDLKIALLIFCVAVLTDAFDGPLARKWNATSRLGAIIDPLADKIIYLGALLALSIHFTNLFLIFFLTLPLEMTLMAIRFEPFKTRLQIVVPATDIGKEKMCLQSGAIIVIMLGLLMSYPLLVIEGMVVASLAIIYSWASLISHSNPNKNTA